MKLRQSPTSQLADEAADWVLRLEKAAVDPSDAFPDPAERQERFFIWVTQSPAHLREFMEQYEAYRALDGIDPQRLIDIDALLEQRDADVVELFGSGRSETFSSTGNGQGRVSKISRMRRVAASVAAAVVVAVAATSLWMWLDSEAYATTVGEQRSCKLEDGSVVILNTNSRIEVRYTGHQRNLRLLRGEALFIVEKDLARPFVVDAGNVRIRAAGTQFDVYRRQERTDISVIQGTVNVGSNGHDGQGVNAGEQVRVSSGVISVNRNADIAAVVSWRERRLVFRDATLSDVVEEFNRYNRSQIRLAGNAGRQIQLSATFENDKPQSLIVYLEKMNGLKIERVGDDWVIREP